MEADGPDRPEVEVLDTERPPGAFEQWLASAFRRREARIGAAALVAIALIGVWVTLPGEEPEATAEQETVAGDSAPPGLRPPPARGREFPTGDWRVTTDTIVIRSGPIGPTVSFIATNKGTEKRDPTQLEVTAGFVDRPGSTFRAGCSGVEPVPGKFRPLSDPVKPQDSVHVRCQSSTRHHPQTPTIDFATIEVRLIPCESEQSTLPM